MTIEVILLQVFFSGSQLTFSPDVLRTYDPAQLDAVVAEFNEKNVVSVDDLMDEILDNLNQAEDSPEELDLRIQP